LAVLEFEFRAFFLLHLIHTHSLGYKQLKQAKKHPPKNKTKQKTEELSLYLDLTNKQKQTKSKI
jgi:hypothetical protein